MGNEKILIVDDESEIRTLVRLALENASYTNIHEASSGEEAIELVTTYHFDLILLDLMLPGMDGLSVCRKLKNNEQTQHIPIIMLTAKSDENDVVLGLEMGASDYVTKPFNRKILIARIRTQLREFSEQQEFNNLTHKSLVMNKDLHSAKLNGVELDLTFSEFEILLLLLSHRGRVFTRNQIISRVKGEDYFVTERAIDVQIVNLRRKLGDWGENIETVRGIGYRLHMGV